MIHSSAAVVFDKLEKTFRTDFYPQYKAHRPDIPSDVIPQFPLIRDARERLRHRVRQKDTGHSALVVSTAQDDRKWDKRECVPKRGLT
jgi:hypothetical protein